ncbi:protein SERAC1 [Nasonia vitripennis]|uniref:Protein SERAC1 n=1 Tax=Nasonia vitripennis TaxID=7425 RepID=A0A7M7H9M3_NASVI|nr:protein SERAC1 [Nasonia vitripennis]XP_008212678.1 protein SERAC1 [Nasonia vitripennis]XP_032452641.1 protein SERAC1 [Nasonia vitripennis]
MIIQNYKKAVYYLKTSGICMVVVSGCWFLYQVRQTSVLLNSVVPTNILELEHKQAHYIYIDDPRLKDIFMFSHENDLHSSLKEKPKNLSYVVTKWWKSVNRNLAFRLFHLASTGDKTERKKAVHSLSSLKHLKDWHYRQIAQMLDAKTAVALARSPKANLRFFLNPPYFHERYKLYEIVDKLHNLLIKLNALCGGCHPCLLQFLHKFQISHRDTTFFEHDLTSVGVSVPPPIVWDQNFLLNCVHAVHHHSSLEEHSKDVADAGGLQILMNVYKLVGDNVDICSLIAKILSNLSLHPEYLEDIFRSGWIGILASWSRHKDIRLAAPASRALANLDFDDNEDEKYSQRIYPLYPLHRVDFKKKLDVVFIHGLLGGIFVTWRQRDIDTSVPVPISKDEKVSLRAIVDDHPSEFLKDLARDLEVREWQRLGYDYEVILHDCPVNMNNKATGPFFCDGDDHCMQQSERDCISRTQCWPKDWLPKDVPNLRIIGINYNTNLSMWTPLCPIEGVRSTIKERSSEFTRKLIMAGVGKRSIVWACHSMGGLLVKQLLVEEWKNGDKNNLVRNTKGIVFYSTPHRGSHVAALNQTTQMLVWPSVEVQELREQSPNLLQLHNDFLKMLQEHDIEIISFGETKPTRVTALKVPFRFVNPSSADPGVGEFFEIPQDHLSICKPASRQSFLYQKVLAMVRRHVGPINKSNLNLFFEKVM